MAEVADGGKGHARTGAEDLEFMGR